VGTLIVIVLLLGAAWAFIVVPSRRRQQRHKAMQDEIDVGAEIITAGGLHGTVREVGDDSLRVEIAPAVIVTLDRRAVAAVAEDVEEPEAAEDPVEEPVEESAAELEGAEKRAGGER
jgi:preprotein translocase subunit YajC